MDYFADKVCERAFNYQQLRSDYTELVNDMKTVCHNYEDSPYYVCKGCDDLVKKGCGKYVLVSVPYEPYDYVAFCFGCMADQGFEHITSATSYKLLIHDYLTVSNDYIVP